MLLACTCDTNVHTDMIGHYGLKELDAISPIYDIRRDTSLPVIKPLCLFLMLRLCSSSSKKLPRPCTSVVFAPNKTKRDIAPVTPMIMQEPTRHGRLGWEEGSAAAMKKICHRRKDFCIVGSVIDHIPAIPRYDMIE